MKKLLSLMMSIGLVCALMITMSNPIEAKTVISKNAKVTDVVWQYGDYEMLSYGFKVTNKNKKKSLSNVKVKITIRGADNKVLGSETQYINFIGPNDSVYLGWTSTSSEEPESIEVKIKDGDLKRVSNVKKWDDVLVISNTSEFADEYSYKVTGEIENKSKKDYTPIYTAVLKQGDEVVGIYSTYGDELEGGDSSAFEIPAIISPSIVPQHDSVECHAYSWL